MVDPPISPHGLECLCQQAQIVIVIASSIGYRVQVIVKTRIAAVDVRQDVVQQFAPVPGVNSFPGQFLFNFVKQAGDTVRLVIIATTVVIQFTQIRDQLGSERQQYLAIRLFLLAV